MRRWQSFENAAVFLVCGLEIEVYDCQSSGGQKEWDQVQAMALALEWLFGHEQLLEQHFSSITQWPH